MKTKTMVKKLLALLLICTIIAATAACGAGSNDSPAASPGSDSGSPASSDGSQSQSGDGSAAADGGGAESGRVLRVAASQDPGSLDPAIMAGTSFFEINSILYDTLFEYKIDGTIVWELATGLDRISDIQYTMHLREGVTFSNGNKFDADDVMFSMDLCRQDPRNMLQVKAIDFDKTNIIDEYTIDLWLTQYDVSQFPGFVMMSICDVESYDKQDIGIHPVGTGPYEMVSYVPNSSLVVQARDGYWGPAPGIKTIEFSIIDEDAQRVNAIVTESTDLARIPVKDFDYVASLGTYVVELQPMGSNCTAAYFNCSTDGSTPLSTPAAREAVMHSIDRQAIVDTVFSGQGGLPSWPASGYANDFEPRFGNMDETYSIGYDPDRARALAEQEGLVGQTLRIVTNGAQDYITMAEIIQNGLQAIGVNATITNYDMASYVAIMADQSTFDIMLYAFGSMSRWAVDPFYNYPKFIPLGWEGPTLDEYMRLGAEANSIYDPVERSDKFYEFLQVFYEVQPWFALTELVSVVAYSKDIGGDIEYYGLGFNMNSWTFDN